MSKRKTIVTISIVLLTLATMASSLPAARADGGYRGWPSIPAMRLHYAGMVKPIDGIPNYNGTFTDPYTMLWTDLYRCTGSPECCGLIPDGEGTGGHPGVDIRAGCGTAVRAVGEGRVIYSYWRWALDNPGRDVCGDNRGVQNDENWGNRVIVRHDHVPDAVYGGATYGGSVTSHYAHLRVVTGEARNGDWNTKVLRGTIIGTVGSTGNSSGPHLHFQIDRDTDTNTYWPPHGVCGGQASVNEVRNNTFSPMYFVQAHEVRQIAATGYYYSGVNFETYRGYRWDPALDFEWFNGGPGSPPVGTDNFSISWYGTINVSTAGWYSFFATADDGIRVWLDDELIIDKWIDQPSFTYQAIRHLSTGNHNVRARYYEHGGDATAKVVWKPVSGVLLATGWEPGQPTGYGDRIQYRHQVKGWWGNDSPPPECSRRYRETWRTGNYAEMIAGRDMSSTQNSYCYYRVFDNNIEIRQGTMIAFWIYHHTGWGEDPTATRHISIDGATTDGHTLRDFDGGAIKDQYGVRTHPALRNDPLNQWYYVEVDLTPMSGKTLDYIMFAYDDYYNSEAGRYHGYVDDFYVFWP